MNYAVEQRLRFIDLLVDTYGYVNRSALADYFGISIPQASNDLKKYAGIAPDNIRYCKSEKRYKKNPEFIRVWE